MAVSAKERLKELGIVLPQVSRPSGSYIPAAASGYLLFTAGQVPRVNGIVKYKGKVGEDSTLRMLTREPGSARSTAWQPLNRQWEVWIMWPGSLR